MASTSASQSPPPLSSSLPESESTTLYFFFSHYEGEMSHSIFAIDVPDPDAIPNANRNRVFPVPGDDSFYVVQTFPFSKYPRDMRCAKLGSKVYFAGGELLSLTKYMDTYQIVDKNDPKYEGYESLIFPRDVYALTYTAGIKRPPLEKQKKSMNTGKPRPIMFVADDKLYVLGSTVDGHTSWNALNWWTELRKSIELFEVYDPVMDKWDVLDPPPINDDGVQWQGSTVLTKKGKVVVVGFDGERQVCYFFDLPTRKWSDVRVTPMDADRLSSRAFDVLASSQFVGDDILYGVDSNFLGIFKLAIEDKEEVIDSARGCLFTNPLIRFSLASRIIGCGGDAFSCDCLNKVVCYLGNGVLGCITTSSYVPPAQLFDELHVERRFLNLLLFKDLGDEPPSDGNRKLSFKAECLGCFKYDTETDFLNYGELFGFYVVGHKKKKEETPRLTENTQGEAEKKKKKKKKKKKQQKTNKERRHQGFPV